jgi:hypothetical protein
MADTEMNHPPPTAAHQYHYSDALVLAKINANHSSPRKRRSRPEEDAIDEIKRKCALSGDHCWKTTGIPTIGEKKRDNKKRDYFIRFQKYTKPDTKKGTRIVSPKFETKEEAEANLFMCHYNGETVTSRKMVDEHIDHLITNTSPEKPMANTVNVVSTAKTTARKKKARFSRSKAMSGAPQQRNSVDSLPALNPMLPGPFNKYDSVKHDSSNDQQCFSAWKIFEQWKKSKDRRATSRLAKVVKEQAERQRLIADLNAKINHNNWIELLEGTSPGCELELCATPNDASRAIMQAKAVCRALEIFHNSVEANVHKTWRACCDQVTIEQKTRTGKTIMQWSRDFLSGPRREDAAATNRRGRPSVDLTTERFPWSKQGKTKNCKMMSPLHPDDTGGDEELTTIFKQWARENLETLSVKGATKKLDDMLSHWTKNELEHLNITLPLKPWTVSGWMRTAGFVYSVYEKKYFVNTHEKLDVILHCEAYVRDALDLEIRKACWIQLPLADARRLFADFCHYNEDDDDDDVHRLRDNLYFEHRYEYSDATTGTAMVEIHNCAFEADQLMLLLAAEENPVWKRFGGCPSVRRNPLDKILIVFGQDESVFKAFAMNKSSWTIDGMVPKREKGEGPGLMVSAMQSYEFGFGMKVSAEELELVNAIRSGEHYYDTAAAIELSGTSLKKPLTSSPFVMHFELGKAKSGYWGYNHMQSQLEDCVDVLRVLFKGSGDGDSSNGNGGNCDGNGGNRDGNRNGDGNGNGNHGDGDGDNGDNFASRGDGNANGNGDKFVYEFAFEFDHSSGHSKQRKDGLSVAQGHVNVGVGGKQALMRESVMTAGDLGDAPDRTLNIGDVASHVFSASDNPPFCQPTMPPYDVVKVGAVAKQVPLNCDELKHALVIAGKHTLAYGKKDVLVQNAQNCGIATTRTVVDKTEGYVGKAKGLKQIAIERGLFSKERLMLPVSSPSYVKMDELRRVVGECDDFKSEMSQLQFVAKQLGVSAIMTPKAHAELAGQGIEYSWGYAKLKFRQNNTSKDQAKQLHANVTNALSTDDCMTITRVRKFVCKAREYKVIYNEYFLVKRKAEREVEKARQVESSMDAMVERKRNEQIALKEEIAKRLSKLHYGIIEKQVKQLKAHRCALDTDTNFIKTA